jgi:hypothetical protein
MEDIKMDCNEIEWELICVAEDSSLQVVVNMVMTYELSGSISAGCFFD